MKKKTAAKQAPQVAKTFDDIKPPEKTWDVPTEWTVQKWAVKVEDAKKDLDTFTRDVSWKLDNEAKLWRQGYRCGYADGVALGLELAKREAKK